MSDMRFIIIGIALILQIFVLNVAAALIVLIGISTIGVVQSIVTKKEIECACMGSKIKVPMTSLTLVENGIMLVMAIIPPITAHVKLRTTSPGCSPGLAWKSMPITRIKKPMAVNRGYHERSGIWTP